MLFKELKMATDMIAEKTNKWEIQCYGTTLEDLDKQIKSSIFYENKELDFLAMSILSDAQELIGEDLNEHEDGWVNPQQANEARRKINVVKHILDIYLKTASYPE
jgi:hypothetical protein